MLVCLSTNHLLWNTTLGGHAWVFLNWALGLQAAGARVVLLENMRGTDDPERLVAHLERFRDHLGRLGLEAPVALIETAEQREQVSPFRDRLAPFTMPLEQVYEEADLLLNFKYAVPQDVVDRFRRSALVDIDPGLLQTWIASGHVKPARHDLNFTIGETVGTPHARFPDCGMTWHFTPPPVYLPAWPVRESTPRAPFTTVTNWWGEYELVDGVSINNEKRTNFIANIDLPTQTRATLELAIYHEEGNSSDMPMLRKRGWRARPAHEVSATAEDYRAYIGRSRGEFSFAKESCMVFANAWISDRTICYLASGKPAVVQHTGPSRYLPDREGLFRFRNGREAARYLDHLMIDDNYVPHAKAARSLVEEHFDAEKVLRTLLETALSHTASSPTREQRATRQQSPGRLGGAAAESAGAVGAGKPRFVETATRADYRSPQVAKATRADYRSPQVAKATRADYRSPQVAQATRTTAVLSFHKIGPPPEGGWETWNYIPKDTFVRFLTELRDRNHEVLDLPTFLDALDNPQSLPEHSALLTFDDGYRSMLTTAQPVLEDFGYPSVLFVPTEHVGHRNTWDAGNEPDEFLCDWDELSELQRRGVAVQSHSVSHRSFSTLDLAAQEHEIRTSKKRLDEKLGIDVQTIAFPYGDNGKHVESMERVLRVAGYRAAFLYKGGTVELPTTTPFRITRVPMGPDTNLSKYLRGKQ